MIRIDGYEVSQEHLPFVGLWVATAVHMESPVQRSAFLCGSRRSAAEALQLCIESIPPDEKLRTEADATL